MHKTGLCVAAVTETCSSCGRSVISYWYRRTNGARGGAVGSGTVLQAGRSRANFPMVSLEFFIGMILPATLWPWDQLSL
jgi:hypothetical protein